MFRLRLIAAAVAAALLSACMDVPTQTDTSSSAVAVPQSQTYLYSWGMFADQVFGRDVATFNRAFSARYGTPAQTWSFGVNARGLTQPNAQNTTLALTQMAQQARDGQDLVVVMLTTHGAPDVLALQLEPGGPVDIVSADQLARLLAPLSNDRQILILQACFSGSLIDELRSPNRIIMTAASATRSSFGCEPDSDNTWFIRNLNRSIAAGGSWQQVFARTQALVAQDEAAEGMPASNPQSFVGANMRDVWTSGAI